MRKEAFEFDLVWGDFIVLRLMRRWVAARTIGDKALPALIKLARELGQSAQAGVALHSLFQLTEVCLGRPLRAECCCSPSLAPDERAVLTLVAAEPTHGPTLATRGVPRGLPDALCWAVRSARMALGALPFSRAASFARCPFGRQAAIVD